MKYHRRDIIKWGIGASLAAGLPPATAEAAKSLPAAGRVRLNFNRGYQFALGDHPGAEHKEYDAAGWEETHLPHSFSLPYWGEAQFYTGYGWYRKPFPVPEQWRAKRVFLEFEAAFQDAEVFINGHLAGHHRGGYTGFSLDITPFMVPGDNLLAVRLNNNWDAETAPRAGEHQFAGGIYRNVFLVAVDPVYVPYCGITVTTPQVSAQSATVGVQTQIKNDSGTARRCTVRQQVLSPTGTLVAEFSATRSVGAGDTAAFDQNSPVITRPQLWHPDHPYRYTLKTTVLVDGKPVDHQETRIGFRWFEFKAESGFFLNGEHYVLDGADVHQDHAGWGNAVSNAGVSRDVQMVKDAGFNFIRGSHYPHHPAFYDACDEMGLLVWSEFCFWGSGGRRKEGDWNAGAYPPDPAHQPGFEASCLAGLGEMIVQNRNHPSVIAWSMCNEVFFSDAPVMPLVRSLLTKMVAHTHALDPARPAGIGGCQRGDLDRLGDIAGYNGDGARLPQYQDPGIPNLVTEYGSVIEDRPGVYRAHWTDGVETVPPWRSGRALWCMFDHGSIAGHFGFMGIVDYFRLPKRSFYWYRNAFAKVPPPAWPEPGTPARLRLDADKTTLGSDGTDDCQVVVTVLDASGAHVSNAVPVTLTVESGPGAFPTGPQIPFDPATPISLRDGQAAIEFRSYESGRTVLRATSPGLTDATLTLTTVGTVPFSAEHAKPRPVRLQAPENAATATGADTDLALSRPTLASSEKSGYPASNADDGNPDSRWLAADSRVPAWWQVDMERFEVISSVQLVLTGEGDYRYRIELSDDGQTWKPGVDQTQGTNTRASRTEQFPAGLSGRFLRITFTGLPLQTPAGLCEVSVYGTEAVTK